MSGSVESRYAYLPAMIGCYIRKVVGHYFWYHRTGNHGKYAMASSFHQRGLEHISGIRMRCDNGTHYICNTVENFLSLMNILHERIRPATQKGGYMHRIIQLDPGERSYKEV